MAFDLISLGDISIDLYMRVDDASIMCDIKHEHCQICLNYSEKIPVSHFEESVGGNAANFAIGCARLGLKSAIYTEVGDDDSSKKCLKFLENEGVDISFCRKTKGHSVDIHTIIAYQNERTILSWHGKKDYKLKRWDNPKILYYTSLSKGFEKFQAEVVNYINANPSVMIVFNPGSVQMKAGVESLKSVLTVTDILIVNKEEAQKLIDNNEVSIEVLHKKLHAFGPKLSVITDADNGSSAYDGNNFVSFGVVYVDKILDKTGAGDAFSAGFVSAIFYGRSMDEALKWGAINAAGNIEKIGATSGMKTRKEIEKVLSSL